MNDLERQLNVAQREMLRFMICRRKRTDDDWASNVQDSTHQVRNIMKEHQIQDWVSYQRLRKWRFARTTTLRTDGRWSTRILNWKPVLHQGRSAGHLATRWEDDIATFVGGNWIDIAKRSDGTWSVLEQAYACRECY